MATLWCWMLWLCFLGGAETSTKPAGKFSSVETDLINSLLKNYNVLARPVTSNNEPVLVDFDLKISKLAKLNMKQQTLLANTRITMRWTDPRLVWNRTEHNGTLILTIPSFEIWTPDILLHNTAGKDSKGKSDVYKARARVSNMGVVNWMSHVTLEASCTMMIKYFPFDEQKCHLNFGSISYTANHLKLVFRKQPKGLGQVKSNSYYSNGNWVLKEFSSHLEDRFYDCCFLPFSMVRYSMVWKRLTGYWVLYLIFPCVCLSCISLFTFFIPAGSGERSGFGITTVLAMSVYLLVISDKLPEKSDHTPLIGVLYTVAFAIMVGILLSTILMIHLVAKKTKPPAYLKRLVKRKKYGPGSQDLAVVKNHNATSSDAPGGKGTAEDSIEMTRANRTESLRRFSGIVQNTEEEYQEEWRMIAEELDKKLFWIFTFLNIIAPTIVCSSYYG